MDLEVEVTEVPERTDELLERVEQGESIVITEQGRPVARMIPHEPDLPVGEATTAKQPNAD
jgi:prevent-host-death family protein